MKFNLSPESFVKSNISATVNVDSAAIKSTPKPKNPDNLIKLI